MQTFLTKIVKSVDSRTHIEKTTVTLKECIVGLPKSWFNNVTSTKLQDVSESLDSPKIITPDFMGDIPDVWDE